MKNALAHTMSMLPELMLRSLTWDQGSEMYAHARLKIDADLDVYFCDPHSPWQRGTNENTLGSGPGSVDSLPAMTASKP
jgi:IS30 family transposase